MTSGPDLTLEVEGMATHGIVTGGVLGGVVLIDQLDDDDDSSATSPVTP